jgi:hypothetical protein
MVRRVGGFGGEVVVILDWFEQMKRELTGNRP